MPKKRFGAEQIVTLLRQIEVSMAQGKPTPVACRDAGISQQSYYRWHIEIGLGQICEIIANKGVGWARSRRKFGAV
jgi:hypothetical protein